MLGASTAIVKLPATSGFTEKLGLDMVLAPAWYFCSTQDMCAYLIAQVGSLLATGTILPECPYNGVCSLKNNSTPEHWNVCRSRAASCKQYTRQTLPKAPPAVPQDRPAAI